MDGMSRGPFKVTILLSHLKILILPRKLNIEYFMLSPKIKVKNVNSLIKRNHIQIGNFLLIISSLKKRMNSYF